jgi:hypothetical protein
MANVWLEQTRTVVLEKRPLIEEKPLASVQARDECESTDERREVPRQR